MAIWGVAATMTMAMLAISAVLHSTAATTYTVGGTGGWQLEPSNGETGTFYDDEFTDKQLFVGDSLLFPFAVNVHNVYEVSQADLAVCNYSNPILTNVSANAEFLLTTAGYHGYVCAVPGHCVSGMHLQVTVLAAAPVAAPSTAPTPPKTPAPVSSNGPAQTTPAPGSPGKNAASGLQSGLAMVVGGLLAGCGVLLL